MLTVDRRAVRGERGRSTAQRRCPAATAMSAPGAAAVTASTIVVHGFADDPSLPPPAYEPLTYNVAGSTGMSPQVPFAQAITA